MWAQNNIGSTKRQTKQEIGKFLNKSCKATYTFFIPTQSYFVHDRSEPNFLTKKISSGLSCLLFGNAWIEAIS